MRKGRGIIGVFLAAGAAALLSALPVTASANTTITLDSFISQTILNNPTVRAYVQRTREAEGSEYSARGIDDVQFTSLFEAAKKEQPQISGFESTEDKQIAYSVGLSKIISQSGTRIGARYQNQWTRGQYPAAVTQLFAPMNPYYTPSVTLTLAQPLMKNIAGIQDQLGKRVTRIQLALAKVAYDENVEAFISDMTQMYLNWLRAYRSANILAEVYGKTQNAVKLIEEQVQARVSEESDLYRIKEQAANYRGQWQGALAAFEALTQQVAAMMNPGAPPQGIVPTGTENSFLSTYASRSQGLTYLKESSRLRQVLDYSLEVERQQLRADKNARLPDLELFVNYTRLGASGDFNRAHGSTFDNDDISGGLNFSVPITDRTARGQYRYQKAKLNRVGFENDRTMLDATSRLEGLYDQERRYLSQVKAYEQQVYYGRKKLDEEIKQYEDGRLTLFQLLQDQTDYTNQRLVLEEAKVDLASVRLSIGELTDVNLDDFSGTIESVKQADGQ